MKNLFKKIKGIIDDRSKSEKKKYRGYLNLLKHLEEVDISSSFYGEEFLCDNYFLTSEELENLTNQGFLVKASSIHQDGIKRNSYKLGIGGFNYLQQRRTNNILIILTIVTIFVGLLQIFSYNL